MKRVYCECKQTQNMIKQINGIRGASRLDKFIDKAKCMNIYSTIPCLLDSVRKFLIATNEFRLSILIVLLFFKLNLMIDCSISVLLYVVGDTQGFD